jgi:secernin
MCDTFVALGNSTADGSVIFGKNSDREPNEAHQLVVVPHSFQPPESMVACTYISVPQVSETYAILLAKPFWIWGAEMGANEKGVMIGNEAVFTRVPYQKTGGLIGMDFLRLALERAATARAALNVITDLLQSYGQGGNCGFRHPLFYHNSYILADPQEAWVLETVGKEWAAEQVKTIRSISNALTIGQNWDLASPDLGNFALQRGWIRRRSDFNLSRDYSDFIFTRFGRGSARQCRTTDLLHNNRGKLTPRLAMQMLRDHHHPAAAGWSPAKSLMEMDICLHAGFGPVRTSQSVGSMVSQVSRDWQTQWVTGTSAPCTGIFKPVWLDAGLPDLGPAPMGEYEAASIWWQHENLHREVLRNYNARLGSFKDERDQLEGMFIQKAEASQTSSPAERLEITRECFNEASQATSEWYQRIRTIPAAKPLPWWYAAAWKRFDREANRLTHQV